VIRYRKGPCPESLAAFAKTPGGDWNGFGGKQAVRVQLVADQRGLCAYCQRRIRGNTETKIDHWMARSDPDHGKDHELDWGNLVGACSGVTMDVRHCDTARGDRSPDDQRLFLHPVEGRGPDPRQRIRYQANGIAYAYPIDDEVERDLSVLNLNTPFLKRGREAVIKELEDRLKRAGFTPGRVTKELDELDSGATAKEFTDVARD